ncbi:Hsp20/alpha crystallin family protein [Bogoriella caseilytica]|uniref:Heat shock protein Hsp20 n=1 Tax=Bogoriella caseilytica TaxID=56055 RepID=A0A3N2B9V2_9MICO|nr:Hsp20/alpha crystallin family protein [Bogoriella caseilytica]ROR72035.1 heat shock protein Hsp20 [Bogoriella caseilytica]
MATFDAFREMEEWLAGARRPALQGTVAMPLDLFRQGENFIARIDLPGVDPATIDVDVEDRTLTIRAERQHQVPEDAQWLTHERPTGTFARQLSLGQGLDLERIEADYADGVLSLTIPVAEEARPRKIQVNHSREQAHLTQSQRKEVAA